MKPETDPELNNYDAGNPEHVGERKKKTRRDEDARVNGLKKVLESADGRVWMWDLLSFCGISRSSFTGNSHTFFNEGQRNVGLRIQADLIKYCPKEYLSMMQDNSGEKDVR